MVVIIIISVLLLALVGLLLTPLIIRLNTDLNKYDVRLSGFMRAWLSVDDELSIHVWILGYHYKTNPKFALAGKEKKSKRKKKRSSTSKLRMKNILNVMRSFRIRSFEASLDTDDYVVNAQLVPISWLLKLFQLNVSVNFRGSSYFRLEIRNNLWRLSTAFLGLKKY